VSDAKANPFLLRNVRAADQIKVAMEKDRITKAAMAVRMQTSRRALDRLLDPTNTSVTLHTLQRAALAVGRQLRLELV
jgi:antitoxin HicB